MFIHGKDMRRPGDVEGDVAETGDRRLPELPEVPAAEERMEQLHEMRKAARENLLHAVAYQAQYYNKKHQPQNYATGNEVMISAKNLRSMRPRKKFVAQFIGPFKVEERIGKQAYRVALPERMRSIHPVFHVSLLEPYYRSGDVEPPPLEIEGEDQWEVEAVAGAGKVKGKMQYLVKWKGYPDEENTWEPAHHMRHAGDKIAEYLQGLENRMEVQENREKVRSNRKRRKHG